MAQAKKKVADEFAIGDDSPLGRALYRGQLNAGAKQYTARARYVAGLKYCTIWDVAQNRRAHLPSERINSSRMPGGESERLVIAREQFNQIEQRLSPNARYILRSFLVEGATAREAVSALLDGFEKETWKAICIYLDELIAVMVALGMLQVPNFAGEASG